MSQPEDVRASGGQAQLLVPRALAAMGASGAAQAEWGDHWRGAPLAALLPWGAQMLSLLDAPEGDALLPTLMVRLYVFLIILFFFFLVVLVVVCTLT